MLKNFLIQLARMFVSLDCPLCGKPSMDDYPGMLCADCFERLELFSGRRCTGCGGEVHGLMDMCMECLKSVVDRPWDKAYSVFRMKDAGRELIHLSKYRNHPEILRTLAHLTMLTLGSEIRQGNFDCIVPIPLFWIRKLQRGYNQSQIFAECLGRELGIPMCNAMKRVKWTRQQAKLTKKERIENLSTAFSVKNLTNVENRAILLVDDVFTTGSTLASATNVLLKAGAARVSVLTLGRR